MIHVRASQLSPPDASAQRVAVAHAGPASALPRGQRGVALVIALILLVVITLVGLAAVSGTILQQKMAANLYDRQVAFQDAEAALRIAAQRIATTIPTDPAFRDCQPKGETCLANPFADPNLDKTKIFTVPVGTGPGQFTVGNAAAGQPQYVIERMKDGFNPAKDLGRKQSAGSADYGAKQLDHPIPYYRVTVRSGDPSKVGGRAVVTLQAVIRNG